MSDYDAIAAARAAADEARVEADISNLPPGYIEGFDVTLDTDYHVTVGAGSTSVEGRQVTINESHVLVDSDFVGARLGQYFYYIYVTSLGDFKVDRVAPEFSDQYLYYAHPLFSWRALGKLWVDSDNDIKYATGKVVGTSNTVTVAAYDTDETPEADYRCTGTNDEIFHNIAFEFIYGAYGGGDVKSSRGNFNTQNPVVPQANCTWQGAGKYTVFHLYETGAGNGVIIGGNYVNIFDITFQAEAGNILFDIIDTGTYSHLYFRGLLLNLYNGSGINAGAGEDVVCKDLRFVVYKTPTVGIYSCITAIPNDLFIDGCIFDGQGLTIPGNFTGIDTGTNEKAIITNCIIKDIVATNIYGFFGGAATLQRSITNCQFDNFSATSNSYGIYINTGDKDIIANNSMSDMEYGIYLLAGGGCTNESLIGNTIEATVTTPISDGGVGTLIIDSDGISYFQGGNVGIGTSVPDVLFHVKKDNATAVIRLERNQAAIGTDDIVGRLEVETQDTTDPGVCAKIEAISEDTLGGTGWRFSTGTASALAEAVRIDQYGNVGIHVVDPAEALEVETNLTSTCIQISNSATDGDPYLAFALSGTKVFSIGVDDGDSDKLKIGTTAIGTNTRLTIDASGNVGIGTASPGYPLHIASASSLQPILYLENTNSDANGSSLRFSKDGTTPADDDDLGTIRWYGDDSGGTPTLYALINATSADVTDTEEDGSLFFKTTVNGSFDTRMVIVGGNVGINATSPGAKLHIDQSSTTGAIPVLTLDQADVSEEFIRFIGTAAAATLTQSIVDNGDVTTATIAGWLKVYVQDDGNQIADSSYYIPIYTLA